MRTLGRALQALGLILPILGLLFGLERTANAMPLELGLLAGGAAVFLIGWQLQQKAEG